MFCSQKKKCVPAWFIITQWFLWFFVAEPGANLTNVIQKTGSPNSINHHADRGGTGSEKEQRQMFNLFSFCAL